MPGVGKSTVGVLLAKELGMDFIDSDIVIQSNQGQTLAQIINRQGVDGFLEIEASQLLTLNLVNHVIATGGSAVYKPAAMTHLAKNGTIVFLDLALPQLRQRLNDLDDRGVTRKPGQSLTELYFERQPLYQRYADVTIDCNHRDVEAVKRAICYEIEPRPNTAS
jgi:shikimate kinase